jgi:hypothetical protein
VKRFCIPPEQNAAFVQAMEDVLDIYQLPHDSDLPLVCLDEKSKQLLEHTREPLAPRPGTLGRVDDEYKRQGTANIFAAIEPLTGACLVQATEHRTAIDMAFFLRRISDEMCTNAKTIRLVMDNLNVHGLHCLYQAFEPAEARRIAKRFEIHHTPKHGSWLNIAESFLSVLSRGCLNQRIGSLNQLQATMASWQSDRFQGKVSWRFTTDDARIKLRRLYPSLS